MPLPTPRAALLLALAALPALLGGGTPASLLSTLALDVALLAAFAADALLAPRPGALEARRTLREPLSAFAPNRVTLSLASRARRPLRLALADAPPPEAAAEGHRRALTLAPGAAAELAYQATPRRRGTLRFGELHVRARGPLGLAARQWRVPLARDVAVYPDLRALAPTAAPASLEEGRARHAAHHEGREFAALRPYLPGDDVRSIDWKATARRGAPVVREWEPERNQTVWLVLDCGRHLSAPLQDGRTKLDHAVDAALALAHAAGARGDRTGAVLFGAEVDAVVPPGAGRASLARALHAAEARLEASDPAAALDALAARQQRRALVVIFTDLGDPETSARLVARARALRRRHLVLVAAVADPALEETARAWPRDASEGFARVAAGRVLEERSRWEAQLEAEGIAVARAAGRALPASVVARYAEVKARGTL